MCGHPKISDLLKIRMPLRIERIGKEFHNVRPTKFARGQRYIVDHDELNPSAHWPLPAIR
jgi:hypothetical protein